MATIAESLSEFILGTWKEICETLHGVNKEGNKTPYVFYTTAGCDG